MTKPGATMAGSLGLELKFQDLYETKEKLRSGSYGTVYTCTHKLETNVTYAVKILDRKKLKKNDDDAVFREVEVMKELSNVPSVVRLIDFFVEPEKLYMVQVFAAGGDVFDRLAKRTNYTEKDARDLAETLLETIRAVHKAKIVHRDLKPENLLLYSDKDDRTVLLADFGFARHVSTENLCRTRCGTPAYVAPEVIIGTPYATKCDIWSIGCILYMILGGYPPFQGANHRELFRKVRAADFVFHEVYWKTVSIQAKRLISNLLVPNPEIRWDADQALQSDWFHNIDANSLRSTDLSSSLRELKNFRPRASWKAAIQAVQYAATAPFWNKDGASFNKQLAAWDADATSDRNSLLSHVPTKTKFHDAYILLHKLRKGAYATVWICEDKEKHQKYAVKVIVRKGLDPKDDEAVLNEVSMMQSLRGNKYVVQLVDFYEEADNFYIVMENMQGGDVFDRIVKMTRYTEKDARDLVLVLLKAVSSMHQLGIAHRDIKPQNLLLVSDSDHSIIKVADFGFARRVHTPESLTSRCGTPSYVAPEILKNIPHDTRVDNWSIGIVAFVLLVGYPPFMEDDQAELFSKIRTGEFEFSEHDWRNISNDAKDFVEGCLKIEPKERWTIEQCLRSPWIKHDPDQLSAVDLSTSVQNIVVEKKNRFRSIAKAIIWLGSASKPTTEYKTRPEDFDSDSSLDVNGSGEGGLLT